MKILCSCCGGDKVTKALTNHKFEYQQNNGKMKMLKAKIMVYSCPDCEFEYYDADGERAMAHAIFAHEVGL